MRNLQRRQFIASNGTTILYSNKRLFIKFCIYVLTKSNVFKNFTSLTQPKRKRFHCNSLHRRVFIMNISRTERSQCHLDKNVNTIDCKIQTPEFSNVAHKNFIAFNRNIVTLCTAIFIIGLFSFKEPFVICVKTMPGKCH